MKKNIFSILLSLFALTTASFCFSKIIPLYDQPNANGKVSGSINSENGIIVIYTPKDNNSWIKVADPNNGNVGWVKSADVNAITSSGNFSLTQHIINTGKGQNAYFIQYGTPKGMTPEQTQNWIKQMQLRQQTIENDMNHMMEDMYKNMGTFMNFPIFVPVIMLPQQQPNDTINKATPTTKK
jgi:hypothetical protein